MRFQIDNSLSVPSSEAKPIGGPALKSFDGDSVQDVVGGLGPDERVRAVA
jgi:hypothetical protein